MIERDNQQQDLTEYELDCQKQRHLVRTTVDISKVVEESNMTYEVMFSLLNEFTKIGYNVITTDIDVSTKGLTGKVPFAFAGIVLTKGDSCQ